MGQICMTCKHKNDRCYCSPNSCCTDYELDESKNFLEDTMIKASNKALVTREQLLNVLFQKGVLAVYNLGMQHMYEYLYNK